MTFEPNAGDRHSLYALNWTWDQDSKLAVDADSGIVVDANPAAEALMGYSREELIGMHIAMLHPETGRERLKAEFSKAVEHASPHSGIYIQRKNGSKAPVAIWSSELLELAGRKLVIVEIRDITDEKQKGHQLAAQNWALSAFSIAALALGRARSAEVLMQCICEAITQQSAYVLAWIGIAEDGREKKIRVAASSGRAVDYLDKLPISWLEDETSGQGPAGVCVRTNTLQISDDSETSPIYSPWRERARQFGIRSFMFIPLRIDGSWHGVLGVYSTRRGAFKSEPVEIFRNLAEEIVHGIQALEQKQLLDAERRRLEETQRHLTEALSASVFAIVTAMELRDPYTAGHENRVAEIAYAIGKQMGWLEGRLQGLRMAAMVHDIGKISVPTEILAKPAELSPEEWVVIKRHPESSYTILKDIPFTWPIADIVRQHHEKLDGSGYPLGLKADAILPEAKVLTVADIVEAMAADRPYREALGLEVALAEIESQAGMQLDADAVRICTDLFREKRLIVPGINFC